MPSHAHLPKTLVWLGLGQVTKLDQFLLQALYNMCHPMSSWMKSNKKLIWEGGQHDTQGQHTPCQEIIMFSQIYLYCACMPACLYGCMPACLYACMYVCMYVCLHACMPACLHACMLVCLCACMPVCLHTCMAAELHASKILQKNTKTWKNLRNVAKCAHNFCDKLNLCSFQKLIFAAPGHLLVSNHLNKKSGVGGGGVFLWGTISKKNNLIRKS